VFAILRVAKSSGELGCTPERTPYVCMVPLVTAAGASLNLVYNVDALAMVRSFTANGAHLWYQPPNWRYQNGDEDGAASVPVYEVEYWA
jgi:hypothetical protein